MRIKPILYVIIALICLTVIFPVRTIIAEDSLPEGTPSTCLFYTDEFSVEGTSEASYFSITSLTFESNTTGYVSINLDVEASSVMKKLGFTTIHVQHWNGSSWADVWTKTDQYSTNTDYFIYIKSLGNMNSGDYYRAVVDLYAKKGFLQVQTMTITSNYILCR